MQRDFHYYCVAVLARTAGFSLEDAVTLAYASNYVDDATDGRPILVGGYVFNPLFTANDWTGVVLKTTSWDNQRKVYIPFHFLPPRPVDSPKDDFITTPDSPLARELMAAALAPSGNRTLRLCRMGVALHTYADTWSHSDFSGRLGQENDVHEVWVMKKGEWKKELKDQIAAHAVWKVGHGQVGFLPDLPYRRWKATADRREGGERTVEHDNPALYMQAAETIFGLLYQEQHPGETPNGVFGHIRPRLEQCFNYKEASRKARYRKWEEVFGDMFAGLGRDWAYDPDEWINQALGEVLDPESLGAPGWENEWFLAYAGAPDFPNTPWACFHRAARWQRGWVLDRIAVS
ncbi:MAG: hypothetical protein KQH53_19110 [Desulfarculaceae bacterium]|nr:hypothetical protein [Desulfarculaceae bacterium]